MSYCGHCGAPIDTPYCRQCGSNEAAGVVGDRDASFPGDIGAPIDARRMAPDEHEAVRPPDAESFESSGQSVFREPDPRTNPIAFFNRTPFQVFLLDTASFGLYTVYWLIANRRLADRAMGRKPFNRWMFVLLIVPLVNLVIFFPSYNEICKRVRASGINPPVNFGLQALAMLFIGGLWKLPGAYYLISLLSSVLAATIHVSVNHAEIADGLDPSKSKLGGWEIAILIVGGVLVVFASFGSTVDEPQSAWFVVAGVAVCVAIAGVAFFQIGRRTQSVSNVIR